MNLLEEYQAFLESKIQLAPCAGFKVDRALLHPGNKPHQSDAIQWLLERARALLAASFGLGKTRVQCELARILVGTFDAPFLVVCPLGVKHQFQVEDGPMLGMDWQYVTTDAELGAASSPYVVTNFERIRNGDVDPRRHRLAGASLDEGSVLRSLGSLTYEVFDEVFARVEYRFVATATPSPNEYLELINYAHWLGIMDRGQALTRFFKRNSTKAGNLTLMESQAEEFWLWVASWALFIFSPADLGYSDEGYQLPALDVRWHRLPSDYQSAWTETDHRGNYRLLPDSTTSISSAAKAKRETLDARVAKAKEIMAEAPADDHWIIWHYLEDERRKLERDIPGIVTVYGSQKLEEREQCILDFAHGKLSHLGAKPELTGSGCNLQRHCHRNIFLSPSFKFQDFIQAIHRTQRYLQQHTVEVHIIYSEAQDGEVEALKRKWQQHDEMVARMRQIVRQYGLTHESLKSGIRRRKMGVERKEYQGRLFTLIRNDNVLELIGMADNSVDAIVTSSPFGDEYEFTEQIEDMGHNTPESFFRQLDFLLPQLLRVLKPGHNAVFHCKDLIWYSHKSGSGFMEVYPFTFYLLQAMLKHGFLYMGECTLVKDVVAENNQTNRLGYGETLKDSSKMGFGLNEKILLARKAPTSTATARADEPVSHHREEYSLARHQVDSHGFWRSNGNALVGDYDYDQHIAELEELERKGNLPKTFFFSAPSSPSPAVWSDVNFMNGLNMLQARRRAEKHVCPFPFDTVRRILGRYTMPGDLILEPFAGLGTVPYVAMQMDRRAIGIELNEQYWQQAVRYCRNMEIHVSAPSLFDWQAEQQAAQEQVA
jgi:DNA modification methylase